MRLLRHSTLPIAGLLCLLLPSGFNAAQAPECVSLEAPSLLETPDVQLWLDQLVGNSATISGFLDDPVASIQQQDGVVSLQTENGNAIVQQALDNLDRGSDDFDRLVAAMKTAVVGRAVSSEFRRLPAGPGVSGIGIGVEDGRPVLLVFCSSDSDLEDCRAQAAAYKRNKLDLDVILEPSGIVTALVATRLESTSRPTEPIVEIGEYAGHSRVRAGTIGCRVVDDRGFRYILGCNHVFAASGHGVPHRDRIFIDFWGLGTFAVGTLWDFVPIEFGDQGINQVDAAIARLDPFEDDWKVGRRTPDDGYGIPHSQPASQICVGDPVMKYGAVTGCTCGKVRAVSTPVKVQYGPKVASFEDQIVIELDSCDSFSDCNDRRYGHDGFCDAGDSGALVVTDPDAHPVGLAFAGNPNHTFVNRIGPVLAALDVSMESDDPPLPPRTAKSDRSKDLESDRDERQVDFSFGVAPGHDSNAAPLTEDSVNAVNTWRASVDLDFDYRIHRDLGEGRYRDWDFGASLLEDWQNESENTAPTTGNVRVSWDRDFRLRTDRKIAQISVGLRGEATTTRVQGDRFEDDLAFTGAAMFTWEKYDKCELDNTVVYVKGIRRHDPSLSDGDPTFDRGGRLYAIGAEHTVFTDRFDPNLDCERAGPFRRLLRADSLTYFFGMEYLRNNPDGTEFGVDTFTFRTGGEQPLWDSRWSVDWYGEAARATYFNSSEFLPGNRHENDSVLVDVGLRYRITRAGNRRSRLSHLDLRAGLSREFVNSNVDIYDYDRTLFTFGIDGRLFSQKRKGAPIVTESGGSRSRRRTTQSGTSPAQVPSN